MDKTINVTVAGLGGQGVLKVTDIFAEVMFRAGYDVKKSEVHGMSQRGGSVSSEVRFGSSVASPMVPEGESDYLVILEETQIDNNIHKLREGGVLITPATIPMDKLAHPKALNTLMLGALAAHFDQPDEKWLEVLKENLPEKVHQLNEEMFHLGKTSK
jgi:indolepyruvate ferredoxin oxidoreductase beta subunit